MSSRIVILGATVLMVGGLCWGATPALADDNNPTVGQPTLSTGPGLRSLSLLPRGGGGDELYAGSPTCVPQTNDLQVGINGAFSQECGDGQWVSFGLPVLTGGATIESINIIHNTNTGVGDVYLMGDCGGNPDTSNILWTGCECIQGTVGGAVTNYCIGAPLVDAPAVVWVVTKYHISFGFDLAFDDDPPQAGAAYGNLVGSGNCGDWVDLIDFAFGFCFWVSLVELASPGVPLCCSSPALCDGDANGDGEVSPLDSGGILARFGLDASDPANCQYDVNCDGVIDPLDSGYVLARFGQCNEPIKCPEGGGEPGECSQNEGCGEPCGVDASTDCCEVHSAPGCDSVCGEPDDGNVEQCVCLVDDFCCESTWDAACVKFVTLFGCADCSETNPDCVE